VRAATPIRLLPGLQTITFFEKSSATPDVHIFAANGTQLTARLSDPLGFFNSDFCGVCTGSGEYYDVFYSDADGTFNTDGQFITVEAVWARQLPSGGGLNLAEVRLNFADGSQVFAEFVSSFVALGDNALPETVDQAVDGDILTATTMGNTVGQSQRLRVTVGFPGSVEEPDPPIRLLPGLLTVTFFEATSSVAAYTFDVDNSPLTERLSDPLGFSNSDFCGVCTGSGEYYDVFYSDADGSFNIDGHFITVEAVWARQLPSGGGLNLAEARLDFDGGSQVFFKSVSSFVALGNNAHPETVGRAVDGDTLTATTMGNTVGQSQRLRVTVGLQVITESIFSDGFESGDTSAWSEFSEP
jgi:phage shock protein PspC (stress-responsive transcriptional regulator)